MQPPIAKELGSVAAPEPVIEDGLRCCTLENELPMLQNVNAGPNGKMNDTSDEYNAIFKDELTEEERQAVIDSVVAAGGEVTREMNGGLFDKFTAILDIEQLKVLQERPEVKSVEANRVVEGF